MHLAQLNIGRLRAPIDDPVIDDFRMNLARLNSVAEASPGYVWRLQDDSGNATSIKPFADELAIVNLTVWESVEALADFTYRSRDLLPGLSLSATDSGPGPTMSK